tara:strand:+ start:1888 stop:2460 length:573 start_codon:yes stop_codon:yes gene_type:complete
MSYTALLVSEQRMKQWTNLDQNVRTEDITPFIIQSQDIYVQNQLGTKFYNTIKSNIISNTLTSDEQTLLNDYIGPTLMQYSLYLMMPGLKYKLSDKGVLSGTSEEASQTTLDELKYLRQSTLDTAEFYAARLREYLLDNPGMYPDYETPGTDGMYPDKRTPYFSGLVIPNTYNTYYDEKCDGCDDCGNCN